MTADPDVVLGPATRLLWRTPESVSLELGDRGVVLDGAPLPLLRAITRPPLDLTSEDHVDPPADSPTHSPTQSPAPDDLRAGHPQQSAALEQLRRSGFLWRRAGDDPRLPTGGPPLDHRRTPPAPRLAGELLSLATRHGEHAAELLDARRHVSVVVSGTGRVGPYLAALLAAAGVGRVHLAAVSSVRLQHAMPGGVSPADEGRSLTAAAETAVLRTAPETDTAPPTVGEQPDLVVLAVDEPIDETRRAALHAERTAHLPVSLGLAHGSVGPLVLPGLTSCLRCADLYRRDRDPLWPALAAQLSVPPRHGAGSDVAVAALVAAAGAIQALTFLDGGDPACIDGTIELHLPDWRLRRRSRPGHVECDCSVAAASPVSR